MPSSSKRDRLACLPRWLARRCDRLLRSPVRLAEGDTRWDKDRIGRHGEELAARWLRLEGGCRVLYRNFRAPGGGEVDVVCRHGQTLVFAEVKTRTSETFGRPAAAVDAKKQELIVRGAREWMRLLEWPSLMFRFDIVEVILTEGLPPDIRWLQAAFQQPDEELW